MIYFARNWFLFLLLISMWIGYWFADSLRPIEQTKWVIQSIVATVMFAMALPLEFQAIRGVLRRPVAPALASLINLGLAPLLAWPLARALGPELGPGLIVAAATPCTLAGASVWTRKAGGNDAVSMIVTLFTNGICFIVTPMWVRGLTAGQVAPFAVKPIMLQLILIVLLPIILAQCLRASRCVGNWSARHKTALGVYAQMGVLAIVMMGVSQATNRLAHIEAAQSSVEQMVACVAITLLLHLILFWIGWNAAAQLKLNREDQIAVGFSASQKTLMVGMSTAMQLGLSTIPLITYHVLQMVVDTILANRLRWRSVAAGETIVDPAPD